MCFSSNYFKKGFFIFLFIVVGIFGITALVMWLWNTILPDLLHVSAIGYWQAMGLLVLSKILFGGFKMSGGGSHRRNHWKEKFSNMSLEEKEAFKEKMKERWGHK